MGAGGIAIIIRALTDNRNRTASSIRSYFTKNGGNLGETGSISNHMFKYRGVFVVPASVITEEQIIESGCDDYAIEWEEARIICLREQYSHVASFLKNAGIEPISAGFEYLPNMEVEITDFEQGVKVMKLLSDLEDDDDVEKVWTNGVFDDILRGKIESFIETNAFRAS